MNLKNFSYKNATPIDWRCLIRTSLLCPVCRFVLMNFMLFSCKLHVCVMHILHAVYNNVSDYHRPVPNSTTLCCGKNVTLSIFVITRDQRFSLSTEFWSEPQKLPILTAFLHFHVILGSLVLARDNGQIWSGSGGCRKLITICGTGKSAAVSCRIWQTGPRNMEKFAAVNWPLPCDNLVRSSDVIQFCQFLAEAFPRKIETNHSPPHHILYVCTVPCKNATIFMACLQYKYEVST